MFKLGGILLSLRGQLVCGNNNLPFFRASPIRKQLPVLWKVFKLDSCKFVLQFGIPGGGPYPAPNVEYRQEWVFQVASHTLGLPFAYGEMNTVSSQIILKGTLGCLDLPCTSHPSFRKKGPLEGAVDIFP